MTAEVSGRGQPSQTLAEHTGTGACRGQLLQGMCRDGLFRVTAYELLAGGGSSDVLGKAAPLISCLEGSGSQRACGQGLPRAHSARPRVATCSLPAFHAGPPSHHAALCGVCFFLN